LQGDKKRREFTLTLGTTLAGLGCFVATIANALYLVPPCFLCEVPLLLASKQRPQAMATLHGWFVLGHPSG